MKIKIITSCFKIILVGIIVNAIFCSYRYETSKIIPINEDAYDDTHKTSEERSIRLSVFSAYMNDDCIEIYNNSPNYDLVITISNISTDEVYYEISILKEFSNYIVLPISALSSGEYYLRISSEIAGYADGTFSI